MMYLGMTGSDDIGDPLFVIVGCRRRPLVALDDDWVRFWLRQSGGVMYGAGCMLCECAVEAKSRTQQRMVKKSDIGRGS